VDQLINGLDNIYNEVSIACIEALGEIGDFNAVPELLDILNIEDISFEYTDLDMKLYILDAIKKIYLINDNAPFDYLYNHLKNGNNTIQESIAFLLGEIGKQEAVKPLIDLLKVKNLDVRKNTVIALGKIGNPKALDNLIRFVENEETYWLIKKVAIDAIYNIFQKNWYRIKEKNQELARILNKDTAILIDYLKASEKENFKVKLSLIKFLEVYGGEQALSALITRVNDFHRVVRIHASNAIKRIEEQLEIDSN
jgi:HEAT repeat protein